MDFYEELKSKNDILSVAMHLGYNGKRSGSCLPGGLSQTWEYDHGVCLVIWKDLKVSFAPLRGKGDVIDLVSSIRILIIDGAVKFLLIGRECLYREGKSFLQRKLHRREAEVQEKVLVENMLTEAAEWYHSQLKNYPQISESP